MSGFIFHLIMVILAIIALTTAFSFLVRNRDKFRSFVLFIPFFGVFTAFICGGYGILGIYPDLTSAYIPRFFGFWGVIGFLLTELSYGVMDMNYPKPVIYGVIGSTTLYGLFDMILNEGKDTVVFIRHDYYTSFEKSPSNHLLFHLIFLLVIGAALIVLSTIWYKSKKTAVEKDFASKIKGYEVIFEDERLTSDTAEENLRAKKIDFKKDKGLVDIESACIILEQYL